MNRIRYTKNGNRWESVKTFNHETNGARYRVLLEEASGTWYVVDAEGGAVAAKGQETSFHKVKKSAKEALMSLGIVFSKEARGVSFEEGTSEDVARHAYQDELNQESVEDEASNDYTQEHQN